MAAKFSERRRKMEKIANGKQSTNAVMAKFVDDVVAQIDGLPKHVKEDRKEWLAPLNEILNG